MFYFLLFFLAQSQIVQTQSINSRSRSRSRILAVCFKLFTFDSGFFSFSAKKINRFFLLLLPNTLHISIQFIQLLYRGRKQNSRLLYILLCRSATSMILFFSIVFCLVLFALIRPIIIAVTIVCF